MVDARCLVKDVDSIVKTYRHTICHVYLVVTSPNIHNNKNSMATDVV